MVTPQDEGKIVFVKTLASLVIGTVGNAMTIVIHKRTVLTSALSVYFIALAVADLGLIYNNCFVNRILFVFDFKIVALSNVMCKIYVLTVYTSSVLSAWTLSAMTGQRAVCVLWPHRANVLCSVGKCKVIVVSMTIHSSHTYTPAVRMQC